MVLCSPIKIQKKFASTSDVTFLLVDDGLIDEADLREVMKACMVENGMHFDEKEVSDLANALFDDAVKVCALKLNMQICKSGT